MMQIKIPFKADDVIRIHDDIIENVGGEFGVLNEGVITFTIAPILLSSLLKDCEEREISPYSFERIVPPYQLEM